MRTRSTQEENWRDTDSFSTNFLSLERGDILYSKGLEGCFNIVPFSRKLEKTDPFDFYNKSKPALKICWLFI